MELSDYFDHYEEQLDEDLKRMKPAELDKKQKGQKTMEKKESSQEVRVTCCLFMFQLTLYVSHIWHF